MTYIRCMILITTVLLCIRSAYTQNDIVKGTVFYDTNRNLKPDPGEKGIEGILVSNQLEVVKTDRNGRYRLPVTDETIIFIIKPAAWQVPLNSHNLPQFYYIHQPAGSPPLKYHGVDPTGPLPASLDFPLFASQPQDTFTAVVFADPQPRNFLEIGYIRDDVIYEIVDSKAAFGIVLGDIMYDDLSLYGEYINVIAESGIPFYHVPGNHDTNYDAAEDRYALETFKSHFGPPYYAFEYGKVHFIAFDVMDYLGRNEEGAPQFRGQIGEKQLKWLENYLSYIPKDHLIVMNMHFPLWTFVGSHPSLQVIDRDSLSILLKERRNLLALAGHMHMIEHEFLTAEQNWMGEPPLHEIICGAVSGSWWSGPPDIRNIPVTEERDGTPNGYHIFSFSGTGFREKYKPADQGIDFQLRISWPAGTIEQKALAETSIIVNVFDGNEKSVVECQIDSRPGVAMTREISRDPFFVGLHGKYPDFYLSWIKPMPSVHIWRAPLPADLKPGLHRIMVKTTNQWGESYQTACIFNIE